MAATALKLKGVCTFIVSIPSEDTGVDLMLFVTEEDYKPNPNVKAMEGYDERDEETYHRNLRTHYHKNEEFIKDFSTNPEWNDHLEKKEEDDGIGENRRE